MLPSWSQILNSSISLKNNKWKPAYFLKPFTIYHFLHVHLNFFLYLYSFLRASQISLAPSYLPVSLPFWVFSFVLSHSTIQSQISFSVEYKLRLFILFVFCFLCFPVIIPLFWNSNVFTARKIQCTTQLLLLFLICLFVFPLGNGLDLFLCLAQR